VTVTNKSANIAELRGTIAHGKGVERAGVTAQVTRTVMAKKDGWRIVDTIKMYSLARTEGEGLAGRLNVGLNVKRSGLELQMSWYEWRYYECVHRPVL
jgi:hypothetical protein